MQRGPLQGGRGHTIVLQAQRVRGDRVNRMRVFRFRLNLRVLLQLMVFVFMFYQVRSHPPSLWLCACGGWLAGVSGMCLCAYSCM